MELKQALDDKLMDYRLRDRLVAEGKVSKSDVDSYLKQLPDESANIKPAKSTKDSHSEELS